MLAVILAAGVGSRLGNPFPKSLSTLPTGERILGRQLRIFRELGVNQICIVVGFKKDLIMEEYPTAFYRYNPIYYITNTSKSLLCALEDSNDDILWLNGDVVFDEEVMRKTLAASGNTIVVDKSECHEEEVKYRTETSGRVIEISKSVPQDKAEGEAVGINKIVHADVPAFVQALQHCQDMDYFEKGMETLIEQGITFHALDISGHRCVEVDFEEDLKRARSLFS